MVLVFEIENIVLASPSGNAEFKHIGSLFNIKLKNTSTTTASGLITEASLKAATGIPAYNADDFQYNIIGKTFGGTQTQTLTFKPAVPSAIIDPEGILEFWAWVPMENAGNWPALDLSIDISGASDILYSNAKTGVASGQAYFLYATVNGTTLAKVGESAITNPSSVTVSGKVYERIADPRDGSVYKIITIGTQTWMAENLKYLPSVNKVESGSTTVPSYYVYDYDETDVAQAKINSNYKTYGVLYNWPAAMAGASSSQANPSGVQGSCPEGWHLPSNAEWTQLVNHMEIYYNYDGTDGGGGNKIAKAMAMDSGWNSSTVKGSVGNNDYPAYRNGSYFSALSGGMHFTKYGVNQVPIREFEKKGEEAYWWSASWISFHQAYYRGLHYDKSGVIDRTNGVINTSIYEARAAITSGYSVRCVKD